MSANVSPPPPSGRQSALTRTDLLVLLALTSLLGLLHTGLTAGMKAPGQLAHCFSNKRAITEAWRMYADDRGGMLVGNMDGGNVQTIQNKDNTWVLGWLNYGGGNMFAEEYGGRANTNQLLLTGFSPLAPYLGHSPEPFQCPADTVQLQLPALTGGRPRSVSMNSYLGNNARAFNAGYRVFRTLSDFTVLPPSRAFVFMDEREDSINDGTLQVSMAGYSPDQPGQHVMVDYPADWHQGGAALSFADGHVEHWRWRDLRTMPAHMPGLSLPLNLSSPANPDVRRIQEATTRRTNPLP